ncbi:uncharacterized protein METZ01_LOCUS493972, partial [marine metagenome]
RRPPAGGVGGTAQSRRFLPRVLRWRRSPAHDGVLYHRRYPGGPECPRRRHGLGRPCGGEYRTHPGGLRRPLARQYGLSPRVRRRDSGVAEEGRGERQIRVPGGVTGADGEEYRRGVQRNTRRRGRWDGCSSRHRDHRRRRLPIFARTAAHRGGGQPRDGTHRAAHPRRRRLRHFRSAVRLGSPVLGSRAAKRKDRPTDRDLHRVPPGGASTRRRL